jgi:hypothetical protein
MKFGLPIESLIDTRLPKLGLDEESIPKKVHDTGTNVS